MTTKDGLYGATSIPPIAERMFVVPSIRFAVLVESVLILDLDHGHYLAFDELASVFWSYIVRDDGDLLSVRARLPAIDRMEFERFVADCIARGFLLQTAPIVTRPEERRARVV
jgi:hypothetical protein